jgi:hypothetical protein
VRVYKPGDAHCGNCSKCCLARHRNVPITYLSTFSGPPAASFKTCCVKTMVGGSTGRRPAGCDGADGKVKRAATKEGIFEEIFLVGVFHLLLSGATAGSVWFHITVPFSGTNVVEDA